MLVDFYCELRTCWAWAYTYNNITTSLRKVRGRAGSRGPQVPPPTSTAPRIELGPSSRSLFERCVQQEHPFLLAPRRLTPAEQK